MERVAVIGFGIAGASLVAAAPEGVEVLAFDEGPKRCSSRVATGLVNPIVLKRRRVVWRAEEALAAARAAYPEALRSADPIYEVLSTVQEVNDWQAMGDHPALGPYLGPLTEVPKGVAGLALGEVRGSFRLQVVDYLDSVRRETRVLAERVHDLRPRPEGGWMVNGVHEVDAVLLAEGYQARWAEHFWGDLGFARTWGQGLRVRATPANDRKLHRSHFLLPDRDGLQQLGASYGWGLEHGDVDPPEASVEQTKELLEAAEGWWNGQLEVEGTWTGIRPNTKDRRPRWGWHPEFPGLGMLNGLGSRGTLHAPLLAREVWDSRPA